MKKTLLIFLLTALAVGSCKNKNAKENSIVGKWKPVEMNIASMSEEDKKEMIENTVLEFTADQQFSASRKDMKQEGTFSYDEKAKKLTVIYKDGGGKGQDFTISWDGEKLVMTNDEGVVKLKRS